MDVFVHRNDVDRQHCAASSGSSGNWQHINTTNFGLTDLTKIHHPLHGLGCPSPHRGPAKCCLPTVLFLYIFLNFGDCDLQPPVTWFKIWFTTCASRDYGSHDSLHISRN